MLRQTLAIVAVGLTALGGFSSLVLAQDPPYGGTAVKSVTAPLVDTSGAPIGTVQLHQDAAGVVLVRIDAAGLPAGAHGMHIHGVGKCEGPAFTSAGAHFDPGGAHKHGLNNPEGPHAGDLTQIGPSFTGTGTVTATTNRISLTGGATFIGDADGSSLIIHVGPDDQVTDPTGNSGARIACAVLAAPQSGAPAPAAATTVPTQAPSAPATGTGSASNEGANSALGLAFVALALVAGGGVVLARRR